MCVGPLAAAGPVLGLLGSGLQAAGSMSAGQGQAKALMLQSAIAQENAKLDVIKGNMQGNRIQGQVEQAEGSQVASLAARGIDPGSGSPLVIQGLTAAQGETDEALARASGYVASAQSLWSAYGAATKADDAKRAGTLGAATALLSGATRAFGPKGFGDTAGGSAFSFG